MLRRSEPVPSGHFRRETPPAAILAIPVVAALVTALGLTQPSPWGIALVALTGASAAALLVWHRPTLAAGLIPALIVPPEFLKTFAYELAAMVAFALVFTAGWRARKPWMWTLDRIEVAEWSFVLWGVATLFWCSSVWWWVFAVRKYAMGAIALWTAWRLARTPRAAWDMMRGVAVGSILLATATLVKTVTSGFLAHGDKMSRNEGTDLGWAKSNYIAAILVLMLPTSLHLALNAPDRRSRTLGWLVLPSSALVMAVAASRGGALLMIAVSLFFIFRERIGRQSLVLLFALLVVVGVMLVGPGSSAFISRFTSPHELGSIVVRLFLLRAGWRRVLANLPFGMGFGQGFATPDYMGFTSPHNFFVVLGYEVGIPGVILWTTVLVLIARRGWAWRRDAARGPAAQALLFTLVTSVANSLFEPTLEGLHFQFLFFWILGTFLGVITGEVAPETEGPATGRPVAGPVEASVAALTSAG